MNTPLNSLLVFNLSKTLLQFLNFVKEKIARQLTKSFTGIHITQPSIPLIVSKRISFSRRQPWMTKDLFRSCRKKNKLYFNYIKQPNLRNKDRFITQRNKFKSIKIYA